MFRNQVTRTFVCCLMLLLGSFSVMAQTEYEVKYEMFTGKIGPYAITLFMFPNDADEDAEVGYYYYNDRPKTHFKLQLVEYAAINAKGSMHLVLKEFSPRGNHTGTFDGQRELRGDGYVGTFTNSKGKKYHFELMQQYE